MKRLLSQKTKRSYLKIPKVNLHFLVIGFLLVLLLGGAYLLKSGYFAIKTIDCKTQYGDCSDSDNKVFAGFIGKNLFLLSTEEGRNTGEKEYVNRKVLVQRVFPSTLKIIIEKRRAVVALISEDPRTPRILVDQEGTVLDETNDGILPTITVRKTIKDVYLGQKVEQSVVNAAQTLYLVSKVQNIKNGILESDRLTINLNEGTVVNFALDRDPQVLVGALQLIESRSRIDGKLPKLIDLRYIKPVLIY